MKKVFVYLLFFISTVSCINAQGYTIKLYQVNVIVNKDASLDITETIDVNFTESHHGIFRLIPYKYKMAPLPKGNERADRQLESHGYSQTLIEDIEVPGSDFSVSNTGDYKEIKIGSENKYVDGDQQYIIKYKMLNAINFFKDKSELYFNVIGDRWDTNIDSVIFSITLYDALQQTPAFFIATGLEGSKENKTVSSWSDNKIFSGCTIIPLRANEGLTVGIVFPKDLK